MIQCLKWVFKGDFMKNLNFLLIALTMTTLVSCGGSGGGKGGGNTAPNGPTKISAQFIDAPVKGLTMVSVASGATVVTTDNGKFNCTKGEELQVKIAGLLLGTAYCDTVIFVGDMAYTTGSSYAKIAAVIQSFSEHKSNGDLDLSTPNYTSSELASLSLATTNSNIEFAISAIISGRVSPVSISAVSVATASAELENQENLLGVISSSELAKGAGYLQRGLGAITLPSMSGNDSNCLPDVILDYSIDEPRSNGVYKFIGSVVSSNITGPELNQKSIQIQMLSKSFQHMSKIITSASFSAGSKAETSALATKNRIDAEYGGNNVLTKNGGDYYDNTDGNTSNDNKSYSADVRISVSPKSNGDASVQFQYTALKAFHAGGSSFDLTEVTCKYGN